MTTQEVVVWVVNASQAEREAIGVLLQLMRSPLPAFDVVTTEAPPALPATAEVVKRSKSSARVGYAKKPRKQAPPFSYEPEADWSKKLWASMQHVPKAAAKTPDEFTALITRSGKVSVDRHAVGLALYELVRKPNSPVRRRKDGRAYRYWIEP